VSETTNKYVICPPPALDDDVWDHVVDRNHFRRSLVGDLVVLTWPPGETPHWAMVRRLEGTAYTHQEALAVLDSPVWTPDPIEDNPTP